MAKSRTRFERRPAGALDGLVRDGDGVLLLGLEDVPRDAFEILDDAGLELIRVSETPEAVAVIDAGRAQIVLADAHQGPVLIEAARALPEVAAVHVLVCVDMESPHGLRAALDAGADDVMRIPFEPEVLALRVATGLRAALLYPLSPTTFCWLMWMWTLSRFARRCAAGNWPPRCHGVIAHWRCACGPTSASNCCSFLRWRRSC